MSRAIISKIEREHVLALADAGKRLDGRKFDEIRPIIIETGLYGRAKGSANVKLGKMEVAAGISLGKMEPYPDSPDSGTLSVTAELTPLSYEHFSLGPPSDNDIELSRVVDRGIRESKAIEMDKLVIESGVEVRSVFVDLWTLNYSGNPIDAASLAGVAALHNVDDEEFGKLPVVKKPIANTFIKIGEHILLDPSLDEEKVLDARFTVTLEDKGNVCAMQKAGSNNWTTEEILSCVKIAAKRSKETRKLLK
jgi:exosome complex component RRP42